MNSIIKKLQPYFIHLVLLTIVPGYFIFLFGLVFYKANKNKEEQVNDPIDVYNPNRMVCLSCHRMIE